MYKRVNEKIIQRIENIIGKENVLTQEADIEPYAHDETPGLFSLPEVVVKPLDREGVIEVIRLAQKERIAVTPRGGGTGLSGGAIPAMGGIVLSLERLDKLIDVDEINFMAVVEAGMINGNLQREAEKLALFYPINPASMDSCTIGGNVAESSGGANAVRYGSTKDYVVGIEAVLSDGKVVKAGGCLYKNATDYNFIQLMLGSEGTLAVITEVILRLIPKPKCTTVLIIPLKDLVNLSAIVTNIFATGITPTMLELMDAKAVKFCQDYLEKEIPLPQELPHLLIRLDAETEQQVGEWTESLGEICLARGALDVLVADSEANQKRIWEVRQSNHDALVAKAGLLADEDVVVPRSRVSDLIAGVRNITEVYQLPATVFGHLGDGNIHVNFLREDRDEKLILSILPAAIKDLFSLVSSLGGKISGEHGIGMFKKPYFSLSVDQEYIRLMAGIKKVFDPNHILNPGKIWNS